MKPIPFDPATDMAPLPFDASHLALAREKKRRASRSTGMNARNRPLRKCPT